MIKGLIYLLFLVFVCQPIHFFSQSHPPIFRDVTTEAGIHFRYTFGDSTYENILESSGSGISIFDYDGDQDQDLYLINGTYLEGISDSEGSVFKNTPNQLYRNNGDGTFHEVGKEAGIDDRHWGMAAGPLDYDNDGDIDLFLLNYGPNLFYKNNGNGTFTDIAQSVGLQGPETLNGFTTWSVGVSYLDYNKDGLTDMMVGNFLAFDPKYKSPTTPDLMPHPSEYKGQASLFYRQEADGSFSEITESLGLYHPDSKCMGLTLFDFDDDGDLDLFQGNDHQYNFLFKNTGEGDYTEVALAHGVAANSQGVPTGSMHGSIGDIDGDGLIDLLVTDLKYGALYRNSGNGFFTDITENSGIATQFAGKGQWAAVLFDYDNDGDLDIFSANGTAEELVLQYPLLLENNGKGVFQNVGVKRSPYFSEKRSGRGAAVWDYDNDGDLDLIISHVDLESTPCLLRNDGGNRNNWLGINLNGINGPISALGAKVHLKAGTATQVKVHQPANSYLSFSDPRILFGLGKMNKIESLTIHWPSGKKENYSKLPINQYIFIQEGKGILTNP